VLDQGWLGYRQAAAAARSAILAALGVVWWLRYRSVRRAAARQAAGLCMRCGRVPATVVAQDFDRPLAVCEQCAALTRRSHTVGYVFFAVMAAILVLVPTAFVVDALLSRTGVDWKFLGTLGLPALGD